MPKPRAKALRKPPGVVEKRVRQADGRFETIRTVDLASPSFGEDMLYVFTKNVAAARRENKRVTGKADVEPAER